MDATRFDAWTRRRFGFGFGFAVGGMASALLGMGLLEDATAKKRKRRKRRCKRFGDGCTPGGKRKCCNFLECKPAFPAGENGPTVCCLPEGAPCEFESDCCWPGFCSETCLINCDRQLKTNFASVDAADVLERVRRLPISTWNYTGDDPSVRHIGPMAQDFAGAFGVGADDRHIHPVDGQGVALSAIQGLITELEWLRQENAALAARVAALERSRDGRSPG